MTSQSKISVFVIATLTAAVGFYLRFLLRHAWGQVTLTSPGQCLFNGSLSGFCVLFAFSKFINEPQKAFRRTFRNSVFFFSLLSLPDLMMFLFDNNAQRRWFDLKFAVSGIVLSVGATFLSALATLYLTDHFLPLEKQEEIRP